MKALLSQKSQPRLGSTERGVEPAAFHAEAMRLTQLRLRSVGFLAE